MKNLNLSSLRRQVELDSFNNQPKRVIGKIKRQLAQKVFQQVKN